MRGTRWLIVVFTLGLALLAGGIGEVAGSFADSETSLANSLRAWTSTAWAQTTQADFEVGIIPSQADTRSRPGDVGLAKRNRIFAFQGGSATFWAYGVPDNLWTSMTGTPNAVGAGGALAYDGLQYVYALRGNNTTAFWRYDTALNAWAVRAAAPLAVGTGGALAYDGSSYIYALRGNNQTTFWRYDTVLNSWALRAAVPAAVAAGGALAYDGLQYVYALRGNNQTTFWRYDTVLNSWTVMATAPARVGAGAALTYDGSRYIYAFRGNNQTAFWRYDTALNSWAVMATAPARVGAGGALACDSLGYVYGFRGSNSTAFWKYNVLGNSWTAMANALGNVANGGALAFAGANTYVNTAAIASQVRDTGTVGAGWDGLFWDETLPLNTDITFEVRASDTLFAAGDVTPTWVSVGGTSPVTSGLPSGRYMQWRATLTTSDIMVTPLLNEVRVYYY
jgi:outer membrane protein assembly factor BamB